MDNDTGKRAVAAVELVVSSATGLAHLNIREGDRLLVDPLAPVRPGALVVIEVLGALLLTEAGGRLAGELVGAVTRQTREVPVASRSARLREAAGRPRPAQRGRRGSAPAG